ncbi:uncharacterized protein SPSK_10435 [Sporothrix schenckii 1099-18]|uniref:Secreted protein n=1 Tax=Sporothrix schenckii 1099-18 TaxID=1397361 RepID=A0A0F2MCK6_SPOSC|nr:uncharacterized protein SPSK_10435 [Sporothrix schenckii 1099-18]KJR87377.1 hypothetical protein SPSK_10435 [Sporothrix schenckii 1099-18]
MALVALCLSLSALKPVVFLVELAQAVTATRALQMATSLAPKDGSQLCAGSPADARPAAADVEVTSCEKSRSVRATG